MTRAIRNSNIFCLESLWADNPDLLRQSVSPILQILQMDNEINVAHLNCNTLEEFRHNLYLANRKYGILYLAFHGKSGSIEIQKDEINLDLLAELMGRRFKNCGVHFASCETINITKTAAKRFIEKTGVSFVSGYKKQVYWLPSAAIDLLYLSYLVRNTKNPKLAVEGMKTQAIPSSKNIGFTFISENT